MDTSPVYVAPSPSTGGDSKNILIIVLVIVLVFSLLGVNIFILFGNLLQQIVDVFAPLVKTGLADVGYASGTIIDTTSDVVADTSKVGIDILHGSVQSVGELLIKASGKSINQPPTTVAPEPQPDVATSTIQSTPSTSKNQWCLVGDFKGTRGCISVSEQDKCISGQLFPNQQLCLNPNLTQNSS